MQQQHFFTDNRRPYLGSYPPPTAGQNSPYGSNVFSGNGRSHHPPHFSESQVNISLSPPPPYDTYRNEYDYGQQASRAFYLQPVQSQQELYVPASVLVRQDGRLRKKASVWASQLDLSQPPRREHKSRTQTRQSSADLAPPPLQSRPQASKCGCPLVEFMCQSSALCDRVASIAAKVNDIFACLDDHEHSQKNEDDLQRLTKGMTRKDAGVKKDIPGSSLVDFRKTWLYANSRLPPAMLPMQIYIPTWQITCMAAQASADVYRRPTRDEREDFVDADARRGTKAMVIKSRPVDDKNIIVLAIRGSKTYNPIDWTVDFRIRPTEPTGFLDDAGNACHAGFLQISRAMIEPVAARLRTLLQKDWARGPPSLILTGHSAGGAVASLLYMHMMATTVETELNNLTGFFKRVHCITFGSPPVSFLPLQNPPGKRYERNVFLHFANEGDVVVRADRSYMSTIVRIVAAPSPMSPTNTSNALRKHVSRQTLKGGYQPGNKWQPSRWEVPPATLSNAGRMVLLREKPGARKHQLEAVQVTDQELRDVIFGDPEMHSMELYKKRIDELAIAAVTGRGAG